MGLILFTLFCSRERFRFLDLFRQSVTDVQLGSFDILPEALKRQVQRTWHQKLIFNNISIYLCNIAEYYAYILHFRYDALLSQNEHLKKQINSMNYKMKQKQKEVRVFMFPYLSLQIYYSIYKIMSEEQDMSYFYNMPNIIIIYAKLNEFACHASHDLIRNSRICVTL